MVTIGGTPERREHPLTRRRTVVLASVAALPIVEFLVSTAVGRDESHASTAVGMLVVLGMVFYRLSSLIGSIERQTVELSGLNHERGLVLDEITRAIEEERTRLAADLHDGPIQRVTGLGMRAYIGLRKLRAGDHGAAAKVLEQIEDDLGLEVRALRAMMTQLRPPVLSERGLVDALRDHAESISSERGIVTVVEGSIDGRLNEEVETGLYRIAQEALMNACRHSRAGRIHVLVEPWDHHVRLTVRDDGAGFDATARSGHDIGQHFGLLAMRERAAMLHGSLTVTSEPGRGTSVIADVPLDAQP
jgi:signal transduction histidine kinase